MRKTLVLVLFTAILLVGSPALADKGDLFRQIRILDDIMVFVDIEGDAFDVATIKAHALSAFKENMRGMEVNNDAYVGNYPAQGYELENVGYIIIKIMSIRTEAGLNVYHYNFEFGIPPRQVYWDTATMGVAPTSLELKKEVSEDIDDVMKVFAAEFYAIRGE